MTQKNKYITLNIFALLLCTLPPIAATLYFFPVWVEKGADATVSGLSVFLLLLCGIPFIKTVKAALKSPSAKTLWFIALVLFWLIRAIVDEIVIISAVGLIGNLLGAVVYKWRDKYKAEE